MPTPIYHITHLNNLPGILAAGGLHSDVAMRDKGGHTVVGYDNIKLRRMTQTKVPCCANRFVGEFVPFYFCPRSPMLFTINKGNTGQQPGCQTEILHLVSTMEAGMALDRPWAFSDVNAGSSYPSFYCDLREMNRLKWDMIHSDSWGGEKKSFKQAEFLVADFFPWTSFVQIGCHNPRIAQQVRTLLASQYPGLPVIVSPAWYY